MKRILTVSSIVLLLLSCNNGSSKGDNIGVSRANDQSFFRFANYFSLSEPNVSFPVWFNDSIIKSKRIKQFSRSIFQSNNLNDVQFAMPSKRYDYFFDDQGHVSHFTISNFYDNKKINEVIIHYANFDPSSGYAITRITSNDSIYVDDFGLKKWDKVKESQRMAVFKEANSTNRMFIVNDSEYWKPLSIESLCKPHELDLVVWGNYFEPIKKYHVHNIVEESEVNHFVYNEGIISKIEWKDDSFDVKRSFKFNRQGVCSSFIDSTFSMGTYISRSKYQFSFADGLPKNGKMVLFRDDGEKILYKEKYEFQFR